jgi:tRNA (cytidine/uridine-2'-O-)-methyltransferase
MNIVLHQPGIALNTGNIGRTCVATGSVLHLIEPFGFRLDEKEIKRAGMDYWEKLDVRRYINFEDFLEKNPDSLRQGIYQTGAGTAGPRLFMATTKAHFNYCDVSFGQDDYIMFGNESRGIPEEILVEYEKTCIRIPMKDEIRSLNLANSVAIVLYEALRQNDFANMQLNGELHRLNWKE